MQSSVIKDKAFRTTKEKEQLFQALENDRKLFGETFEVMLTMVISDPDLTLEVADLIAADYRDLYLAILEKGTKEQGPDGKMGCCKDFS